jgi:GT2 family glycosyltransferase
MSPSDICLSAVVVTWNSAVHVRRTLASLTRELTGLATEVILVDNGSTDESLQIVRDLAPHVRIIQNPTNEGVARARNRGMAASSGRHVLLLDSDAELAPGSVREMLRFIAASPMVGVIGPRLTYPDGTIQYSCRRFPTLQGKILRQLPGGLRKAIAFVSDEEMHEIDRTVAQPVDYVIGACQLFRREVIRDIGVLDERMFYGPEDVDFCLRAWQAGWSVFYLPSAVAVHHEQRISRRRPSMLTLRHGAALAYYFWKHRYLWHRPVRPSMEPGLRRAG